MGGLALAVFMSVLVGAHWTGGAVHGFLDFVPSAFAYFLVCLHCNSKKKLQVIVLMLLFVCLFVMVHGLIDLRTGLSESGPFQSGTEKATPPNSQAWNVEHPYLFSMRNDSGEWFYRLRGSGSYQRPERLWPVDCLHNSFAVHLLAAKEVASKHGIGAIAMLCIALWGVSNALRGTIVALVAVALVIARQRMGTIPALFLVAGLFIAASALHATGGREISALAGTDRTGLWGQGLQMLKSHPLFGVGFGSFADHSDVGLTAHNSIVVCAAELGLFGLYFWSLFLLSTLRDALILSLPASVGEGVLIDAEDGVSRQRSRKIEGADKAEVNRLGIILVLSLTGFLVQGMFLSRAFVMTFFLLGGMAEVVYQMALARGMVAPRLQLRRTLMYAGGLMVALVLGMYVVLRILNLMQ